LNRRRLLSLTLSLATRTARLVERARAFFYRVVLCPHACPACGSGLVMTGESRCRCSVCRRDFDPTVALQRCTACGGQPRLRIRRYECADCGTGIASRFVFDGLVFDADYFRQKIAEHRERKRERRERVRQMLAGSRSGAVVPGPLDFAAVPGLMDAINSLTTGNDVVLGWQPRNDFDLRRYEAHIQACLGTDEITFDEIPSLIEDRRLDRIWRFIAIIFLAHAGLVQVWQERDTIMVMKSEIDREGCELSGELEEADGVEGSLG